ncbi:hypothetical protein NL676_005366 [Syzygium grande]|nr:hypothetical protein NL676_005366 [Syzygium grande]
MRQESPLPTFINNSTAKPPEAVSCAVTILTLGLQNPSQRLIPFGTAQIFGNVLRQRGDLTVARPLFIFLLLSGSTTVEPPQ